MVVPYWANRATHLPRSLGNQTSLEIEAEEVQAHKAESLDCMEVYLGGPFSWLIYSRHRSPDLVAEVWGLNIAPSGKGRGAETWALACSLTRSQA